MIKKTLVGTIVTCLLSFSLIEIALSAGGGSIGSGEERGARIIGDLPNEVEAVLSFDCGFLSGYGEAIGVTQTTIIFSNSPWVLKYVYSNTGLMMADLSLSGEIALRKLHQPNIHEQFRLALARFSAAQSKSSNIPADTRKALEERATAVSCFKNEVDLIFRKYCRLPGLAHYSR